MGQQLEEAHGRLVSARENVAEKDRIERRVQSLSVEREAAAQWHEAARLRFDVEKDDVDDLEGSVLSMFGRMFSGDKRRALELEKKELAAAKLQLEEAEAQLAAIDKELGELGAASAALTNAESELEAATNAMEQLVRKSDPEWATQLDALATREAWLRSQRKEITEAMHAGSTADVGLGQIIDSLASVRTAEIGTSLGSAVTENVRQQLLLEAIPHAMLHQVRSEMGSVRHALIRFQDECRDVANTEGIDDLVLPEMPGVADYLIADLLGWHTLEVIHDAKWRVDKTRDQVQLAYAGLRHRGELIDAKIEEVVEQRATLLAMAV